MGGELPITGLPRRSLPPVALVTGDPDRIPAIAKLLDDPVEIAARREYVSCRGRWRGTELVVASHGVGAPGAALLFAELAIAGVETFVRAGTCGALIEPIGDGDLVVATAAVRRDGMTDQMVPEGYPAVADPRVALALERAAARSGRAWHRGIVLTQAMFFPGVLEDPIPALARAGVIAVEMELAALLVTASVRGLRAGGILAVDGNLARGAAEYDPHREVVRAGVAAALEAALDALHDLAEEGAP